MSEPNLSVAIVGGGIGGLTAAVAISKSGHDVDVYERSPRLAEVGAGVMMMPNGIRVLFQLGFEEPVTRLGARIGEGSMYYRMDGAPVTAIVTRDSAGWNGMYGMHRADLLGMLADALPAERVHTGHHCIGVEQDDERVRLTFDNGTTAEADLVIGQTVDFLYTTFESAAHRGD
jgi:salicylate hydroxylase